MGLRDRQDSDCLTVSAPITYTGGLDRINWIPEGQIKSPHLRAVPTKTCQATQIRQAALAAPSWCAMPPAVMGLPMASLFLLLLVSTTPLVQGALLYEVDEEVLVGHLIGDLRQSKEVADMGPNLEFKVMYSAEAKHLIKVNELSGELSVALNLDREALCMEEPDACRSTGFMHTVQVAAMAKGEGSSNLRLLDVQLLVRDINDHAPAFRAPHLNVSISESEAVGRRVPLPRAIDPDAGDNGIQHYRISAANGDGLQLGPFSLFESDDDDDGGGVGVDGDGGMGRRALLELREQLDREAVPSYELLLWGEDGGNPKLSGSVLLTIVVVDANDNAPVFVDPPTRPVRITEHSKVGTSVVQLRAADPDADLNGAITYSFHTKLTSLATQAALLVDGTTGLVTVGNAEKLDRETMPVHRLVVVARDGGHFSRSASVTVTVELNDDNDNAPVFEVIALQGEYLPDGGVKIVENLPSGTPVVLISVSDPDLGSSGTVDVRLEFPSGPSAAFELTSVGGSGGGGGAGSTSSVGAELGSPNKVQFLLKTTRLLDYEEAQQYNVSVLAADRGNPKLSKLLNLVISVVDVNDNTPVFMNPASIEGDVAVYEVSLRENGPAGTVVLNLLATDADSGANGAITFTLSELAGGGPGAEPFSLNKRTGQLTLATPLDRETRMRYELSVEASDGGSPQRKARAMVRVTVLDENDNAPTFVGVSNSTNCMYQFFVEEETSVGTYVGTVSTSDLDEGDNARVALNLVREAGPDWIGGASDAGGNNRYFSMTPGGVVRTLVVLDREVRVQYELSVRAVDSGRPALSASCRVSITVSDTNDNAPVITSPNTNDTWKHVRTFSPAGMLVGVSVTANDIDAGDNGRLLYEIAGGNPKGIFLLNADSGALSLARTVSGSDEGLHRLVVRVRDRGGSGSRRVRAVSGLLEAATPVLLHVFVNETVENVTLIEQLVAESLMRPLSEDVVNLGRRTGPDLPTWAIVALVAAVGVILLAVTIGLIAFFCRRRRRQSGGRGGKKGAPSGGAGIIMSSSSSSSSGQHLQSQQAGDFLIAGSKKGRRKQRTNKGAVAGIQMQSRGSVGERLAGSPESQPFMKRFRFSSSSSHGGGTSVYRPAFLAGPDGDPSPPPASTFKPDTPSFSTFVEAPVGRVTGSGGRGGGGGSSRGGYANDAPRSNHRQHGGPDRYDDGYEHHMSGRPPLPTTHHLNRTHDRSTPEGSVGGRDDPETGGRLPDIARYPPPQFQDYADPVDADVIYDPRGFDPHDYSQDYDDQHDYSNQHDYSDPPDFNNQHNYDNQDHQHYGEQLYSNPDRDYEQEAYSYPDYDRPHERTARHVPTTEL
ncbi:protocadherin-1-like isoform X2 [Lethenteron reissneri]|uniref:protocadherin-1-like isoform X2 n=1 Tax=Lethenteron reissneri TaxID=7753 RepID=UPI002AB71503|nr:protocadherin-1-like isoform X2 [Lethenteron reissneri]